MSVLTHYNSVIYTIVYGILGLLLWKLFHFVKYYVTLRRSLGSLPSLPRHWLLGNSQKGQINGSQDMQRTLVKAANDGHKVYCVWIGPIPLVCVLHADTFKELNKQTREKCKGYTDGYRFFDPWLGDGLLMSEGKKWERNRKLLTPAFHFDILNGYIDIMNDGVDVLLDKLEKDTSDGKTIDIFPYICATTLDAMLKCSLSYDGNIQKGASEKEKGYIQAVRRISEISWRRSTEVALLIQPLFDMLPVGKEFYRLCDKIHEFTGGIIQSRIKQLKNKAASDELKKRRLDFLDILLTAKDGDGRGLSPEEIQNEVDTFTFEGHDTTASAISFSIYALGRYPDLQQKVYNEVCAVMGNSNTVTKEHIGKLSYLSMFIKEALRCYTAVPAIGRVSDTNPVVLDGKEVPPNVSIYVWIYAIHHNEDTWPDHMKFDPERFNQDNRDETDVYGFIPFSAGSRNCIGQVFAMNEIKINLAKIVKRFKIAVDESNLPILLPDIIMRAENGVNIKLKPRQ